MEIVLLPSKDPRVERVRFNGIVYRRYPNAKTGADRNYYRAGMGDCRKGYGMLHRDIWKHHHGEIPPHWEVHHVDENPLNNAVENLEALPKLEHNAKHLPGSRQRQAIAFKSSQAGQLERLRRAAAKRRQSPEGREWHRQHGKQVWEALAQEVEKTCEACSKGYTVRSLGPATSRFCSNACKSANRRRLGVDNVEANCFSCGKRFHCSRFQPRTFCSRQCSAKARSVRDERHCLHCGVGFSAWPSSKRAYCTTRCAYDHRSVLRTSR